MGGGEASRTDGTALVFARQPRSPPWRAAFLPRAHTSRISRFSLPKPCASLGTF